MYIMYTYLAIISQPVTCGDQYKLVKSNFPNIVNNPVLSQWVNAH